MGTQKNRLSETVLNFKLKNFVYLNQCDGYKVHFILKEDCMACGSIPQTLSFSEDDKLQDIINFLIESVTL